jgi:hypothetical protein
MDWADVPAGVWVTIAGILGGMAVAGITWVLRKMQTNPGDLVTFLGSLMDRVKGLETRLDELQEENTKLMLTNADCLSRLTSQSDRIAFLGDQVTSQGAEIKSLIALLGIAQSQLVALAPVTETAASAAPLGAPAP